MQNLKVLIVGATGFIGQKVAEYAVDEGWEVTVGVRNLKKAEKLFRDLPVSMMKIDLTTDNWDLKDFNTVFNLAALLPKKTKDIEGMVKVNSLGVYKLIKKCRNAGVERVIHSSSMAVYGSPEYLPVDEKHPKNPRTYYGISKLTGELFFTNDEWSGVERVILRYSTVYGPGMDKEEVIPLLIKKMLRCESVKVVANNTADFVCVEDVAEANILAAKAAFDEEVVDFNIGSGKETSIKELAGIIRKLTNSSSEITEIHSQNPKRFYFNIDKARNYLGYNPKVPLEVGIRNCIESLQNRG